MTNSPTTGCDVDVFVIHVVDVGCFEEMIIDQGERGRCASGPLFIFGGLNCVSVRDSERAVARVDWVGAPSDGCTNDK